MRLGRMWRMRGKKEQFPTKGLNKKKKKQTKDGHPRERKRGTFTRKNFFLLLWQHTYRVLLIYRWMCLCTLLTYSIVYILYQWSRGASGAEREIVRDREKEGNQKSIFFPFFYRYLLEVAGCVYVYIFHVSSRPEKVSNWAGQRPGRQ